MEVKELRVGNLLMKGGIVVTIDARSIFDIWDNSPHYSGIPLNKRWLKRLGFEQETELKWSFKVGPAGKISLVYHKNADLFTFPYHTNLLNTVRHVHDLQNLFYALRGYDLEVNQLELKQLV
jgi:hypothetical protein